MQSTSLTPSVCHFRNILAEQQDLVKVCLLAVLVRRLSLDGKSNVMFSWVSIGSLAERYTHVNLGIGNTACKFHKRWLHMACQRYPGGCMATVTHRWGEGWRCNNVSFSARILKMVLGNICRGSYRILEGKICKHI
jgi:hypothetical protein